VGPFKAPFVLLFVDSNQIFGAKIYTRNHKMNYNWDFTCITMKYIELSSSYFLSVRTIGCVDQFRVKRS
jgi:hypothetical protein